MAASLGQRCVVWDTQDWRVLCDVAERDWASSVALSADGGLMAHFSRQEIAITDVSTGARVRTLPIDCELLKNSETGLSFHPSGQFQLAAAHDGLGIIQIGKQAKPQWKQRERVPSGRMVSRMFTSDGEWLCCGTNRGFRVYSWTAVLESNDSEMPVPVLQYDLDENELVGRPDEPVYAITHDMVGFGFLFGGLTGELFHANMESGEIRSLLTMPEQASILELIVSHDAQAVGIVSHARPSLHERRSGRGSDQCIWSIWSYPKLLAATV
jgi:hypothetical protein